MATKTHFLLIDPQNDLCDPQGSLYVKGAESDMERLGGLVRRLADRIDAIHVTLDTHHLVDVAHPIFWVDAEGRHPDPVMIDYVVKGTNPFTEHYSAIQADVPDESDPATLPNTRLIAALDTADIIAVGGEALSHCVANTVKDLADTMGPDKARKLVLLIDCSSPVAGFEKAAESFLEDAIRRGIRVVTSDDYLAERRNVA